MFAVVTYGKGGDVSEEFTEVVVYNSYEEAKKKYNAEVNRLKTEDLINKKDEEFEDKDSYEISDDWGHVDGVFIKEFEIGKPFFV